VALTCTLEIMRLAASWYWHERLDRPIVIGSPVSGSINVGTVERGARSESVELRLRRDVGILGGEDDMTWVDDVGTGVG
jgi:hypothetical protein